MLYGFQKGHPVQLVDHIDNNFERNHYTLSNTKYFHRHSRSFWYSELQGFNE